MASTPLVSVLIPTYNPSKEFLTAALQSLQKQTLQGIEVIVNDDCSTTDVAAIIAPFQTALNIAFAKNGTRLGIGGNWNATLARAQGTYVAFLFQDDTWSPDYLSAAVKTLEANPTTGFVSMEHVYGVEGMTEVAPLYEAVREYRTKHVNGGFHHGPALLKWWLERELTPNIVGEPSFVVIRREATERMGEFLKDMPQFLDVEYWTRLLLGYDWYFLRGNYGSFRVHAKAASAENQASGQGLFDRLRCLELLIEELSGEDRETALKARSSALRKMIGKFFRRVGSGKKVSAQGSGELRRFCLRHPFIVFNAFVEYLAKGDK